MKLVDILARELKVWPNDLGYDYCVQMYGGRNVIFGGIHNEVAVSEIAEDNEDAKVTRAQWQAAVDALKAEKAVEWNGEGLPPVGTDCEYSIGDGWYPCSIRYVLSRAGEQSYALVAWCHHLERDQYLSHDRGCKFRPIRTPEQIAAEDLHKIIEGGLDGKKTLTEVVDEIIANGYRKSEIVDN